jgi:hypothetical protein
MAKPTVKVEVAWTDGPYVASPTWSDITTYVRSVSTSRGRTDDWQNFDSGSATLVLDNRDRRFDPTYTAGPNYGNLQPRRQIRVTADAGTGSGYVALFRGFVDGWPVRLSQAGFDSTVTITAYETLGLIAQDQVPADWSDDYIVSLSPTHYWRLQDTINPADIPQAAPLTTFTLVDAGTVNWPLSPNAAKTPTQNVDTLAAGIPSRTVDWAGTYITAGTSATDHTYSTIAASIWFTAQNAQYSKAIFTDTGYDASVAGQIQHYVVYSITNQRLEVNMGPPSAGSPTWRVYYYPVALNLAVPHHLAFAITNLSTTTAAIALYVDGQEITSSSNTTFTAPSGIGIGATGYVFTGGLQQVAVWETASGSATPLTSTVARTTFQLGSNVLTETTAARFSRIIAQTPLPAALYSCTASPAGTVGRLTVGGAFVNNELQLANDSEGGELYTTKAGVLTMTNRTWYQTGNAATSQATFGSGGIPIQTEIEYAWNADNIRNTLDVSWSGDAVVTVSDSTSRSTYGVMQDSWTTALSTYTDAQTLGNLLVGFGKLPRLVISAVEVGQALTAANWNTVLGLELLDRITVVVPEPVGSNLTQTQIIQQIEHDITPGNWTTRILGSARWSSVFTIGTSYLDGTDILG